MPNSKKQHIPWLAIIIGVMLAIIFGIDYLTPLGYAVWVLNIIPCALCLFSGRPRTPVIVATLATLSLVSNVLISEPGTLISPALALFNRGVGVATVWSVAGMAWMYIRSRMRLDRLNWVQMGQVRLTDSMRGEQAPAVVASNVLNAAVDHLEAQVGVVYQLNGEKLSRLAGWAIPKDAPHAADLQLGEGLAGQAVRDLTPTLVRHVPAGYLPISSALGQAAAGQILIAPLTADGRALGVIELGFLDGERDLTDHFTVLAQTGESIGVAMRSALYRERLEELLEETQRQSEELQVQQEELRVSNEELEERGQALIRSQSRLETQQTELEHSNSRLEEHAQRLEAQKRELLVVQNRLTENADALEQANRYKSEFLANMSHELRTPLNSSLILSKLLQDNKDRNLSPEQVRYASTIYSANTDLLSLINDILDLSKVEAGHMHAELDSVLLDSVLKSLSETFEPVALQKSLSFSVQRNAAGLGSIHTDQQKLLQVLKNLLSNAFKFTDKGQVNLTVVADLEAGTIAFLVRDSGIGIDDHQQSVIFEAFQQADGTTSRKYGGSGLGLSISRQFAHLLGGEITVASTLKQGSTFTLTLPIDGPTDTRIDPRAAAPSSTSALPRATASGPANGTLLSPGAERRAEANAGNQAATGERDEIAWLPGGPPERPAETLSEALPEDLPYGLREAQFLDDREHLSRGRRLILAIEDDASFARILYDLAHELDFDCLLAATAGEGMRLAREHRPCGILLDVSLPDGSGLAVLERLKQDSAVRHIPVHIVSVNDHTAAAMHLGAIGYTLKPTAREDLTLALRKIEARTEQRMRRLLVVEDDTPLRENIKLLLQTDQVEIDTAGSIAEALQFLESVTFDCVVMDLSLPDGSGFELLTKMADGVRHAFPPVIVYTGRSLTPSEEQQLRFYSKSIIIKGAKSPERLLDEVTLFLHSIESDLPADQQRMLKQARQRDAAFEGRTILLAEDDVRNIFALSHVIEPLGATLEIARNGREALDILARRDDVDLVLMDIMMPEMDGITAMREIRKLDGMASVPIIALTAKAMPSDRQLCLDAGANDYISKPIDVEKLLSLCRVWLSV